MSHVAFRRWDFAQVFIRHLECIESHIGGTRKITALDPRWTEDKNGVKVQWAPVKIVLAAIEEGKRLEKDMEEKRKQMETLYGKEGTLASDIASAKAKHAVVVQQVLLKLWKDLLHYYRMLCLR